MPFPPQVKEKALVRSRRCCCICNEFAGLYTNVHHIHQEANGGSNTISNAVVLCLRCHGEVGHYNDRHPIGNKYSPSEVKRHRDQWWDWCKKNPTAPLLKLPVYVSPTSILLVNGKFRQQGLFKVVNKSDYVVYNVYVKIGLELSGVSAEGIQVTHCRHSYERSATVGGLTVSGGMYGVSGKDETGADARYMVLGCMEPKAVITSLLDVPKSKASRPEDRAVAWLTVAAFETEPHGQQTFTDDTIAAPLVMPEDNFRIEGVGFFVIHNDYGAR